jgi:hypothetical protein
MAEIHAVELAVQLGQVLAQRKVPERAIVKPLVPGFELGAGGERDRGRRMNVPFIIPSPQ